MNTQVMVVGSAKTKSFQRRRPRIRLSGFWLNEIGFKPDSLISADYENRKITLKLQGEGIETYSRVVKELLRNSSGLLQVKQEFKNKKQTPHLEVKGFWLEDLGFKIGDVIVVKSEHGAINIKVLNIEE